VWSFCLSVADLCGENGFNELSLQAKTVAFQLIAAHKVVGTEVEPRPLIH